MIKNDKKTGRFVGGKSRPGKIGTQTIERGLAIGVDLRNGYLNICDGRVRIFCRKFPGTSKSGYCLRSRLVWWLHTGEVICDMEANIHHLNHDRSDDRFRNLEKISHDEHSQMHNAERSEAAATYHICKECDKEFSIPKHRLKEKGRGSFCSQECYKKYPKEPRVLKEQIYCCHGHKFTKHNTRWIKFAHSLRKACKTCAKNRYLKRRKK